MIAQLIEDDQKEFIKQLKLTKSNSELNDEDQSIGDSSTFWNFFTITRNKYLWKIIKLVIHTILKIGDSDSTTSNTFSPEDDPQPRSPKINTLNTSSNPHSQSKLTPPFTHSPALLAHITLKSSPPSFPLLSRIDRVQVFRSA